MRFGAAKRIAIMPQVPYFAAVPPCRLGMPQANGSIEAAARDFSLLTTLTAELLSRTHIPTSTL
jgi:hypothetical protein